MWDSLVLSSRGRLSSRGLPRVVRARVTLARATREPSRGTRGGPFGFVANRATSDATARNRWDIGVGVRYLVRYTNPCDIQEGSED